MNWNIEHNTDQIKSNIMWHFYEIEMPSVFGIKVYKSREAYDTK